MDSRLPDLVSQFPEVEAISDLHGIGPYSALLIVAQTKAIASDGMTERLGGCIGDLGAGTCVNFLAGTSRRRTVTQRRAVHSETSRPIRW